MAMCEAPIKDLAGSERDVDVVQAMSGLFAMAVVVFRGGMA